MMRSLTIKNREQLKQKNCKGTRLHIGIYSLVCVSQKVRNRNYTSAL